MIVININIVSGHSLEKGVFLQSKSWRVSHRGYREKCHSLSFHKGLVIYVILKIDV